jgi:hypothetical protein
MMGRRAQFATRSVVALIKVPFDSVNGCFGEGSIYRNFPEEPGEPCASN